MSKAFDQFHYQLSKKPDQFNFEEEGFDIKDIYVHYALKHDRNPTSAFMDKMFAPDL